MSIRNITDSEIAAASVSRLSDRPNESGGYGRAAMTASELRAAFDALGKLCASRYNELCAALKDGSAAGEIAVGEMSLEELLSVLNEKADNDSVAEALLETDEALRALAAEDEALKNEISEVKEETETKLDTEQYLATPAVKGEEHVPLTFYDVDGGALTVDRLKDRFVIRRTKSPQKGFTAAFLLASFPIVKGESYCVYTEEPYPARYYADRGDEMHKHIADGMRLRVTVDTDGDGKENKTYKLSNCGVSHKRIRCTSEPISFTAEEDGVADISLSIYNTCGMLSLPFTESDTPITLRVSRVRPGTPLVLDEVLKPVYRRPEKEREGDTLLSVPMPDGDAFGAFGYPVSVSGNMAYLRESEEYELRVAYDEEGVTILPGSRQSLGIGYELAIGEFSAVKGRTYSVFTRESHVLGEDDGYYLIISDGDKSYQRVEVGADTSRGFVFTAEKTGRHKVAMCVHCYEVLVPTEYSEEYRISAFVRDVTGSKNESLAGSFKLAAGENTVLSLTVLPSGRLISDAEEIGIKLMGCCVGDSFCIEIEDGKGTVYKESRAARGTGELFVLETALWTARHATPAVLETSTDLSPFGRGTYPSTGIHRLTLIYTPKNPFTLSYTVYGR